MSILSNFYLSKLRLNCNPNRTQNDENLVEEDNRKQVCQQVLSMSNESKSFNIDLSTSNETERSFFYLEGEDVAERRSVTTNVISQLLSFISIEYLLEFKD